MPVRLLRDDEKPTLVEEMPLGSGPVAGVAVTGGGGSYFALTYTRGALASSTVTFTVGGVATDPSAVTAQNRRGDGRVTLYTYGVDAILTKVSTGVYNIVLDTTPTNGEWVVHWVGIGMCQAAADDTFQVQSAL